MLPPAESVKVWKRLILIASVALLSACRSDVPAPNTAGQALQSKSPVILEIGGRPESIEVFDRFMKSHMSDVLTQANQTNATISDDTRSRLFDEFVKRQVIVNEARKKNISVTSAEISQAVQSQRQQSSSDRAEQESTSLTANERTEEITSELLTVKYYKQEVLKGATVSAEEIQAYYDKNKSKYQKNGFEVREIRVQKKAEADELHQKALLKPADFGTLAKQHSKAPNAERGGLMYYEIGQLPQVLEQEVMGLKEGGTSRVVQSNYGYHIFHLEKKTQPLPLDKLKTSIEQELLSRKNQNTIDDFDQRAISNSQIRVYFDRLGFNYTGRLRTAGSN